MVFGAMFYSLYMHRQSKGAVAANFHESTKAELVSPKLLFNKCIIHNKQ
jgi:heme/copper-type cytochrome/quinol oxidase subunit 2